ncbi:helix-turn-helix domain-containing protein [Planctomicrobium sp. SH661]|uniref:helix-turn-helix domain-containing protein n=1 Tax=Planctomicrobium sp. SH661 TaxID=3448124 RepID=UPI003F5C3196
MAVVDQSEDDPTPHVKTCSICNQTKPLSAFNRHRLRKDGRDSKCRECNSSKNGEWYRRRQQKSHRLYSTYVGMKGRCHSPCHDNYAFYGARGITVCKEWRDSFSAFEQWAVQNGYRPGLQLDRIDNDLGYSPENCRFVTASENNRNKRPRGSPLRNYTRVTPDDVIAIRKLLDEGVPQREIGRRFNVCHATVWAIKAGRTWVEVT